MLWFRRTFNLPPTDPRYLHATLDDMLTEYWAHHYDDMIRSGKDPDDEVEDPDFDAEVAKFLNSPDEEWEEVPNE